MGAKKVSISESNPIVITNTQPISEPSLTLYLSVIVSLLGAVGLGLVIGYISPVIDKISDKKKDVDARSWYGSITPFGALFGGMLAPVLVKFLGKKKTNILIGIPFTIGWASFLFDKTAGHELFYVGRFLTGLSCGLVCGSAPAYVSEISTVNKRGILGSCFQLFCTIGILVAALIGNDLSYQTFALICAIPTLLMSIFMIFMPESPIQILSNDLSDETIERARSELRRLRSTNSSIDDELNQMIEAQREMNLIGDESIMNKFGKSDFYKPLFYSLLLMEVQQFSGVNAILFYANSIFESAGVKNLFIAGVALTACQSLATGGEMFIVERLGRRILLILSACGCALGLGVMAIYTYIQKDNPALAKDLSWLPLVTLVFYIISFSIGLAPIPWLMVPELTPANHRSFISGVATAFNWSIAFIVTKFFEPLTIAIGAYGAYLCFMTNTIVGVALLLLLLPETGGRNLDDIVRKYGRGWRNSLFNASASKRDSIALGTHINQQTHNPNV